MENLWFALFFTHFYNYFELFISLLIAYLMGDNDDSWSIEPFLMTEKGNYWIPPSNKSGR